MAHMALELAMLKVAYGTGVWGIRGPEELGKGE